jgi:hypothetical protein
MTTKVTPGVVLSLNNTEFSLSPDNMPGPGEAFSFTLENPVDVGTPGDLATFISTSFGGAALPDLSTLPSPLDTIAQRIASLDIVIEQFDLKMPATKDASGAPVTPAPVNSYSVGLAGSWPDAPISVGPLKIKGLFLKVSDNGATT